MQDQNWNYGPPQTIQAPQYHDSGQPTNFPRYSKPGSQPMPNVPQSAPYNEGPIYPPPLNQVSPGQPANNQMSPMFNQQRGYAQPLNAPTQIQPRPFSPNNPAQQNFQPRSQHYSRMPADTSQMSQPFSGHYNVPPANMMSSVSSNVPSSAPQFTHGQQPPVRPPPQIGIASQQNYAQRPVTSNINTQAPSSASYVGQQYAGPPRNVVPPLGAGVPPRNMGPPLAGQRPPLSNTGFSIPDNQVRPPTVQSYAAPPNVSPGLPPMSSPPTPMYNYTDQNISRGTVGPPQSSPPVPSSAYLSGPQSPSYSQMQHPASFGAPNTVPRRPTQPNPDQMPSPIQVIEEDRANRSGVFSTPQGHAVVPPLVTTDFICQDQGNSNPRFIRSTVYNVPCTSDMLKNCQIPFALSVSPFAKLHAKEHPPPLVDFGEIGPVRCKRCKAYMNPHMRFIDGGRRFICAFCSVATDVPDAYFNHLDHTGYRIDRYERAELCLGSYEFMATKEYCKNEVLPEPPAFIFMIDVSYHSIKTGLVHLICQNLKQLLFEYLPKEVGKEESDIRIGIVTYARELHFYNLKGTLAQPQMLVVTDLEDVFVPLLDGFFVNISESEAVIDSLLSQIPEMFSQSHETVVVLGPVIQAGLDALKSANCSGKLFIFHTSLPTSDVPGSLKNRDDNKLLGTDKEKTILNPQSKFYTKLGQDCVGAGCSVDLFLFPNSYIDIASISEVCRLTSGNIYKYSFFQADLDGERFLYDLQYCLQKSSAFDAIMRVRTSTGIRAVDFIGNIYMSNTTDVELAAIDSDECISVEIKHDDKLNEGEGSYVQVAVLYTSIGGQRRLRIHNLAFSCCTQLADLFRTCDLDVIINFMCKKALRDSLNSSPKSVRENVMNQTAEILTCYRRNCASAQTPAGQLILPECMKLLPLYMNCLLKSDAISGSGGSISTDDRSYLMFYMNSMDVASTNLFLYPRLIKVGDIEPDKPGMPEAIRCSVDRLQEDEIYVLENGLSMFLWIGLNVSSEWVQNVFGVQSVAQINIEKSSLLELDTSQSRQLRSIIERLSANRMRHMKLTIVRQRDKLEPWFNHFLVEDKTTGSSYVDFLCHIHKEIQSLLS